MAKKTYAEVKESLGTLKDEAKQAKKDLKNFCKDQKLDPEAEHTGNKKWVKLKALVDKSSKQVAEAEAWLAENKEKKEGKPRATKYEYPAEVQTAADKKKWRAKARAEAKRKEKGESTDKGEKASKKKDKEAKAEKADKGEKSAKKKDKKAKEEKVASED